MSSWAVKEKDSKGDTDLAGKIIADPRIEGTDSGDKFSLDLHDLESCEDPPSYVEKEEDRAIEGKTDKFDVRNIEYEDPGKPWNEMTTCQKTLKILLNILGICSALGLLYIFICSLDILQASFQLLTGRVAGDVFSDNVILNNPIAGLMIGVLVTVLLQSSSTSTSIIVSLVGSGVLGVREAIYIIMGANIGTSVTNTIVSLTQSTDKDTFRRSFAGATVHDMFNWLTVLILLPVEIASGYLYRMTAAIVKTIPVEEKDVEEPQFLKVITKPLTSRIIKVDKSVLTAIAEGVDKAKYPLCRYYCSAKYDSFSETWPLGYANETYVSEVRALPWTIDIELSNDTSSMTTNLTWRNVNNQSETCSHHFTGCAVEGTWCDLSDQGVGGILLACSLVILLAAVFIMVKILSLLLRGPMAKAIRVGINADFPGKAKFLTGYVAILVGAGITMLVQSSSVFTSTLTPLVGLGVISVDRMYPLTLGSNIGTCLTGVLAALTADANMIHNTMQVSLSHLFFNVSGIIIFYPIPAVRKLPLKAAKFMGNTTAEYRWFAITYLIATFLLIPAAIFGLSLAGWQVLIGVLVPIVAVIIAVVVIKVMQNYCPSRMHPKMRDWKWLPKPLRSLEPCNRAILACCYNKRCTTCRDNCCGSDEIESESSESETTIPSTPSFTAKYENPLVVPGDVQTGVILHVGNLNPAFDSSGEKYSGFSDSTRF